MRSLLLIIHLLPSVIFGQTGFSLDATPNLVFSDYDGTGLIPSGFLLKKSNLSFSGGASVFRHFNANFVVRLGFNYFINNYRSEYYVDRFSLTDPFNKNAILSYFFEPKLSFLYNVNLRKKPILFVELGMGISISNSVGFTVNSEFIFTELAGSIDTINASTTVAAIDNASPFKFYFSIGRTIMIAKEKVENLNLDVIISYRFSQNEELITKTFFDNNQFYSFNYFQNSSFLGLTLRLNYTLKKQLKAYNKT